MTSPIMDENVKITCLMPTYNRLQRRPDGTIDAVLIEESIEAFLRQSYQNTELLILNDTPGQRLSLSKDPRYENIRIYNFSERFETLGHKYRYGIEVADGQYFTPWDDDDVSLPNRLATSRQYLQGADTLQVHGFYYLEPNRAITFNNRDGYMADLYEIELARRVGYSLTSYGSDAVSRCRFSAESTIVRHLVPTADWHFYLYRWATTRRLHLSSMTDGEGGYARIGSLPIEAVDYELQPHWEEDYVALVRKYFPL